MKDTLAALAAVNWPVYLKLSGMFFLEYAVWGGGCPCWPPGCWDR